MGAIQPLQPLSTLNTLFLFLAELLNGNSCEMISFNGTIDVDILTKSMRDVALAHPHLRSRIIKKGRQFFKELSDTVPDIAIEEKSFSGSREDLDRFLSDNIWCSTPVDIFNGPPLRIILTQSGGKTWLQVLSSHVWSDAKAGYLMLNDIITSYNNRCKGLPAGLAIRSNAGLDFDQLFAAKLAKSGLQYSKRHVLKLLWKDLFHTGGSMKFKPAQHYQTRFEITHIGGTDFMQDFKRASKVAGVTIHSFLVATLTGALHAHDQALGVKSNHYRIHDMFSLRTDANGFDDMYDCCVLPFDFDSDCKPDFRDRLDSNSVSLDKIKQGKIYDEYFKVKLMIDALKYLPRPASSRIAMKYLVEGNVLCTNPGIIPFTYDKIGDADVDDFYSFSQVFPPGHLMFVFTTFRQSFRLATVYNENAISRAEVQKIIAALQGELKSMIANLQK